MSQWSQDQTLRPIHSVIAIETPQQSLEDSKTWPTQTARNQKLTSKPKHLKDRQLNLGFTLLPARFAVIVAVENTASCFSCSQDHRT
eukprot:m.136786 g.136786  ORF g.136786 m.136786 type:complete len:87 (+) comp14737_c0_seq1:1262-1522(+)